MSEHVMTVRRVHDDTGTHIEPEFDQTWDEETKLRWHAAVVAHDTGLAIRVHPHTDSFGRTQYGLNIGEINQGGQTSLCMRPYYDAWDALSHISIGARAVGDRIRQIHRPADYRGLTICVACSAYDGISCDNSPCGYEYCPTIKALGPEAP
jgi:hypothetical protein